MAIHDEYMVFTRSYAAPYTYNNVRTCTAETRVDPHVLSLCELASVASRRPLFLRASINAPLSKCRKCKAKARHRSSRSRCCLAVRKSSWETDSELLIAMKGQEVKTRSHVTTRVPRDDVVDKSEKKKICPHSSHPANGQGR